MRPASHDAFIGYSRKYANQARGLAEKLQANHFSVWIDEYRVLFAADHMALIRSAIAQSRWAVFLVNEHWVESPTCCEEALHALAVLGPERVIVLSSCSLVPLLAAEPRLHELLHARLLRSNADATLDASLVAQLVRLQSIEPLAEHAPSSQRTRLRFGLTLDPGGLFQDEARAFHDSHRHRMMSSMPGESYVFRGLVENCSVKLLLHVNPFDSVFETSGDPVPEASGFNEEDATYNRYVKVASQWMKKLGYEPAGIHFFYYRGERQLAFTYLEGAHWHRRYVLSQRSLLGRRGETSMDFVVGLGALPAAERPAAFARMAPKFDAIVSSLAVDNDCGFGLERAVLIIALSTQLVGFIWSRMLCPWDHPASHWLSGTMGLLAGAMALLLVSHRAVWIASKLSLYTPALVMTAGYAYPPPISRFVARGMGGIILSLYLPLHAWPILIPAIVYAVLEDSHDPSHWMTGGMAAVLVGFWLTRSDEKRAHAALQP